MFQRNRLKVCITLKLNFRKGETLKFRLVYKGGKQYDNYVKHPKHFRAKYLLLGIIIL